MGESLIFAYRGNTGFGVKRGFKPSEPISDFTDNPKANPCRTFEWSPKGRYFAYCDGVKTVVMEATSGRVLISADLKRTTEMMFSPKESLFLTWEPYTVYGGAGAQAEGAKKTPDPNLRVWDVGTGQMLTSLIAQKQSAWRPQFSEDESVMARLLGSELLFHKGNLFEKYDTKLTIPKMEGFSLSPGTNMHVACYMGAHGGQPATVQVRRLDANHSTVTSKTFFKSDSAKLCWNAKGTALLILSVVDVDSTNRSYYGEQSIHLVNVMTGDACQVPLSKNGPVYQAKWNPNGREFAVCYGYMPSRVTLYNLRAEAVFSLADGQRNEIHYNAFGSILLVCGFGNLASGKMEFWDVEKKKIVVEIAVPNTTFLEWAPDGQHFVTATTTPRLRIDNCYRFWHFTGRLISEVHYASPQEELWQVSFRPLSSGIYNAFPIPELTKDQKAAAGLLVRAKGDTNGSAVPAGAVAKASAYVPPHLRKEGSNKGSLGGTEVKPVLSEKEKKIRNLEKKVQDIEALKKKQAAGEPLELNQLEKMKKEDELIKQLEELRLS